MHSAPLLRRLAALGLAFGIGFSSLPASAATPPPQPSIKVGVAVSDPLTKAVLNASFYDQNGKAVTLKMFKGDTIFLVPVLTLCGDTCPFTTGNLLQLDSTLIKHKDKHVVIIALTVDPYRDSVTRMKAYAKMIGARFQLWSPAGVTTKPVAPAHYSGEDSVGTGDVNVNVATIEKFFGWQAQVVKEDKPAAVDWMARYEKLTYDINHSDGFYVISSSSTLMFVGSHAPRFVGKLAQKLADFLNSNGKYILHHPTKGGWTPAQALASMAWVAGRKL